MAKLNIRKGDKVVVIAGKEAGKTSTVLECFPEEGKVTVKGLNVIVKHNKPRSAQDKGGIVKKEGKLEISNIMVVCPVCDKATRVSSGTENGKKVRVCKKCGASLDGSAKKATATKKAKAEEVVAEEKAPAKKATTKTATAKKATEAKTTKASTKEKTEKVAKTVRASASKKPSTAKKTEGK